VNYVFIGEVWRLVSVNVHETAGMKRNSFVSRWRGFDIVWKGVLIFAATTMPTVQRRIQQTCRMLPAEKGTSSVTSTSSHFHPVLRSTTHRVWSKLHRMALRHFGKFVIKAGNMDEVHILAKQFLWCGIHHWWKWWRHWTDWSGNSGLGGSKLAPTIGRSKESSFGAWVKGVGGPALREGEGGSRGTCTRQRGFEKAGVLRVNMSNHRPLIN